MQLKDILMAMEDLSVVAVQDAFDTCVTDDVVWMKSNLNEKDLAVDVVAVHVVNDILVVKVSEPLDYMQATYLKDDKQKQYENDIARIIKERNRLLINSTVKNLSLTPKEINALNIMVDNDFKTTLQICKIIDKARLAGCKKHD